MPAPVFRSKNSTGGTTSTSLNATQPSDTAIGDLLLCQTLVHGADVTFTMSGWAQLSELFIDGPAYDFNTAWYWLIATRAGTQNHAISWGGASRYNAATVLAVQAGTFDPVSPIAAARFQANGSASRDITCPAITPPVEDCLDVLSPAYDEGATLTQPAGYTLRADDFGPYFASSPLAGAGDFAAIAVTSTVALPSAGGRIAVAPAVITQRLAAMGAG